jgi:hypothetical protein
MIKRYRLDPKNPPRLTDDEARRLDKTPIDYSDIPPLGDHDPIMTNPEVVAEIAIRAFARAKDAAIRENERRPGDPWLQAMLDDVYDRLGVMIKARGAGEFSPEEEARYWALVRELTEIDHAIREAK